jgi:hypothetical protein
MQWKNGRRERFRVHSWRNTPLPLSRGGLVRRPFVVKKKTV